MQTTQQLLTLLENGGTIDACTPQGELIMGLARLTDEDLTGKGNGAAGAMAFDFMRGLVSIPSLPNYPCAVHGATGKCPYQ